LSNGSAGDDCVNNTEAHERRGAHFTFDSKRFIADLTACRNTPDTEARFPSFDHSVGDPILDQIAVNADHQVVIFEGNYLLLDIEPWNELKDQFWDEGWFVHVPIETAVERVTLRHMAAWGWDREKANQRAQGSDKTNMCLIDSCGATLADLVIESL
jgi:pantothenate kinase